MKACCFTGHRELPAGEAERLEREIRPLVLELYGAGYREFRVGGALGFDMRMAELLIDLRDTAAPELQVVSVLPYPRWRERWPGAERIREDRIMEKSDRVVFVRPENCKGVYITRNIALVEGSSFCIAYCNRLSGGTAFTLRYALKKGLEVAGFGSVRPEARE